MERRNRIVLTIMALFLIVVSGVSFWTTVLRIDLMNNNSSVIAYNNTKVVNTVTGVFDLSSESNEELTLKSVSTNASEQVCSYSLIYSSEFFNKEFYITVNGEDVLIDSGYVILVDDFYTVESNGSIEKTFTVTSSGNSGNVIISNIECK